MWSVVKKPLVTEKNTIHSAAGVYAFEVDRKATKTDIKDAIEKSFDVKVDSVKTMVCRGKVKRVGRNFSKVRYWKKALVKLQPGESIAIFEGA
ncbi:MAG: 50S ribosomal protein L23 [Bdellovibrionaceae bacterium]|nr:50S ribosomal protein L23 [Pseudobdellovibrionaceae bacterium]|tara:strand:+ start:43581 stop:43859 length:279 start_codon:yes stop_codon:yes gene_type:complete